MKETPLSEKGKIKDIILPQEYFCMWFSKKQENLCIYILYTCNAVSINSNKSTDHNYKNHIFLWWRVCVICNHTTPYYFNICLELR